MKLSRLLQIITHPATMRLAVVLSVIWGSRTGVVWGA
jgi:hypothetical protein